MSLIQLQHDLWRDLQEQIAALQAEVQQAALNARAEQTGGTAVYANVAALPVGYRGALATVDDDGTSNPALYWHDGTSWQKVTVT